MVSIRKYKKKNKNIGMIITLRIKKVKEGYLVLLYDKNYLQQPGKFRMHWLGPYEIKYVTDGGVVQLQDLVGKEIQGLVSGSRLKLYRDTQTSNP
jgi:hypothetical protein